MLRFLSAILALALLAGTIASADARTIVAELGTAPLLGTQKSTTQMRATVASHDAILRRASARLGLSTDQYEAFRAAIDRGNVAWVTVPRNLDAMTWASGNKVYVLHDVTIPAHTNGWQVNLTDAHHVVSVYMPAKCGNLSVVRRALPVVAQRSSRNEAYVAPPPSPAPAAPPVEEAPAPVVAAAPVIGSELPPPPPAHKVPFLGLLGAALLGLLNGGGGGGSVPGAAPPSVPVLSCPLNK